MKSLATNISPELLQPLPPLPLVREFGAMLCRETMQASVMDLGCGTGRNARFLADLGHKVLGITNDLEEAQAAQHLSSRLDCRFIVADIRDMPIRSRFNVILANEVLHQISKDDSRAVLERARAHTTSRGVHVVSGYLASQNTLDISNQQRCFKVGELKKSYEDAGWRILSYEEVHAPPTYHGSSELINSKAEIIARKP